MGEWGVYGGDAGGTRYSPLAHITRENVRSLAVAWTYRTREADPEFAAAGSGTIEATPLMVDGTLYLSTPLGRVIALDPATGTEWWVFDPRIDRSVGYGDFTNRGPATWVDRAAAAESACRRRIYVAPIDGRIIALDSRTGQPCTGFGEGGTVWIRKLLRIGPFEPPAHEITSPPVIINDLVVTGSAIADNSNPSPASGEIFAFDARSGALKWKWDPIPQDSTDAAWSTWQDGSARRTGAANVWSVMVADTARGLIFAPTSSPAPDYFGGKRVGSNRYANSVVALRAATGEVAWHFQTVHHDLWDYDNAAPPALADILVEGRRIPVVLQATKTGMLFVLDRETGEPVYPVTERPVPRSTVPGEEAWPTQPFSRIMLSPHGLGPEEVWGATEQDRAACRVLVAGLRNEGIFTPPSLEGTLVRPSNIGGAHWGGVAVDEPRDLAIVPVNRMAAFVQLIPMDRLTEPQADSLERRSGFQYTHMEGTPFVMRRGFANSPRGLPCVAPPWGALVAVDLRTGEKRWEVPLGGIPSPPGVPALPAEWGGPNLGGPIVTAGGLVFIGASLDRKFRAFDVETGSELWSQEMPAGGKATPMTYEAGGRQFVVISAGWVRGGKADNIVAFALKP
jgi:quinoprotein glucose dehydrogenase